ncbi:MAG TPA: ankyrin repeat domain-containing protein, partial [Phycisphaerae bacterium]|nr:ankyrin repeat domain-containing protein [Phycisphaerae bacterium]
MTRQALLFSILPLMAMLCWGCAKALRGNTGGSSNVPPGSQVEGGKTLPRPTPNDMKQFLTAAEEGDVSRIESLLEEYSNNELLSATDRYGSTPLHLAAVWGRKKVAALLIAKGADVNAVNTQDTTPLHWAADSGKG